MSRSAGSDDRGYADFAAHKKPGRPKRGWRHPETAKRIKQATEFARAAADRIETCDKSVSLRSAAYFLIEAGERIRKAAENEEYLKGLDR